MAIKFVTTKTSTKTKITGKSSSSSSSTSKSTTTTTVDPDDESFTDHLNRKTRYFGLIMSMLSIISNSMTTVVVKIVSQIGAVEIIAIRTTIMMAYFLSQIVILRLPFTGQPGKRWPLFLRAIISTGNSFSLYCAIKLIPLSDVTTITMSAPILVFVLAHFLLGEPLTMFHIGVGLMAMVGVTVVSRPTFILKLFNIKTDGSSDNPQGVMLALVSMVLTALVTITVRMLKDTPSHVVVFWFTVVCTATSFLVLMVAGGFVWPGDLPTWAWLLGIGIAAINNQLFMALSLKYEKAGIISVSRTLTIVLAFAWDIILFNSPVESTSIWGSALVIISVILCALIRAPESPRPPPQPKNKVDSTRKKH